METLLRRVVLHNVLLPFIGEVCSCTSWLCSTFSLCR